MHPKVLEFVQEMYRNLEDSKFISLVINCVTCGPPANYHQLLINLHLRLQPFTHREEDRQILLPTMIKSGIPYLTTVNLGGNTLSRIWKKTPDVAYEDVFDNVWCVKGLIVTRSDLVVTWKVMFQMSILL